MKRTLWIMCSLCLAAWARGERISPQTLAAAMAAGERVTLIDLRPLASYTAGTLPDALHMGVRAALEKNLAGRVVFFDDGQGVNLARRAVDAFDQAGKRADELAGGYAAWQAAGLQTSERKGLSVRGTRYVTYQDLTGAMLEDADDVVLVDLRDMPPPAAAPGVARSTLAGAATTTATPATIMNVATASVDLAAAFPAYRLTRQPAPAAAVPRAVKGTTAASAAPVVAAPQPLYVLIDAGDGVAEKKAVELRAAGCARVAVLAGGEVIVRRKGQSGLVRRGPGTGLANTPGPDARNLATISEEVIP